MIRAIGWSAMLAASRLRAGGVVVNEHVLTLEQLRRHVDTLARWFEFIHPDDLAQRLAAPRGRKPFCLLTFDDGHLSNATIVAPELKRLGIPACFLVVTDFVGSRDVLWFTLYSRLRDKGCRLPPGLSARAIKHLPYDVLLPRLERACREHGIDRAPSDEHTAAMTWEHVRTLRRQGFGVGAHGTAHAILTRETREAARASVSKSIARVSAEIGGPCSAFAFPNGNYTAELARHALSSGAKLVFTVEPTWADRRCAAWRLPRVQLFDSHDAGRMELKLAVSALGRFVPSGDGTGVLYRRINRLARRQPPEAAPAHPAAEPLLLDDGTSSPQAEA